MLLDLKELVKKHNLKINGVIQVGSHEFQEWTLWQELGLHHKIMFEADPETFKRGIEKNGRNDNVWLENIAVGNINGFMVMNTETRNSGQSSTFLEPAGCLEDYPDIVYNGKKTLEMIRLDDYTKRTGNNITPMNLLVIDTEGYELEVLKGAVETLNHIDYILLEVSCEERYKGCPLIDFDCAQYPDSPDLDKWLGERNFKRIETNWGGINFGDALYIKEKPVVKVELPEMFKPKKATKKTKIDKVFYINLESRKDRKENLLLRLTNVGLKATRFEAKTGANIGELFNEGNLNTGMIGCFLSHVALWEKILADEKLNNVLILEDDAVFADNFNQILDIALSELPEDYDMLYLGASEDNAPFRLKTDDLKVVCPADHQWRTHAYIVNRKVLPRLIEKASKMYAAIDQVLVDMQPYIQCYATMPYIVSWDDSKSDIQE